MRLPGTPSLVFLVILLLLLPWAAQRSAKRFRVALENPKTAPLPPRGKISLGMIYIQSLLLILAWAAGNTFDYHIFALPYVEWFRVMLAGTIALALCLGLRLLGRLVHSEMERRRLFVYQFAPRTRGEWSLWIVTILIAGIAEEAAYRGVGMSILWYALGNSWAATLLCATSFAFAHAIQGWKSGIVIFGVALVLHGLVAVTQTLLCAMAVHIIYNLIAGWKIHREACKFRLEAKEEATLGEPGNIPNLQ